MSSPSSIALRMAIIGTCLFLLIYLLSDFRLNKASRTIDLPRTRWSEEEIVQFMLENPQRPYFSRLFLNGGFETGCEIGVGEGKYAQHMIEDGNIEKYYLVEPFPSSELKEWVSLLRAEHPITSYFPLIEHKAMDNEALDFIHDLDFIYLDGAHDYPSVKEELEPYYQRINQGGVLAGHDYCNFGEKPLDCKGCSDVPACGYYTSSDRAHLRTKNQNRIVRAVQEWLVEFHPELQLYHTKEDFTSQSLTYDGIDYDLVLSKTRNPSWFVIKPVL